MATAKLRLRYNWILPLVELIPCAHTMYGGRTTGILLNIIFQDEITFIWVMFRVIFPYVYRMVRLF